MGHGVTFINDKHPRATDEQGRPQTEDDWNLLETVVESGASVGSGAVILGGVRIGEGANVGAGAVVGHDVAAGETVVGNPHASWHALATTRAPSPEQLCRASGLRYLGHGQVGDDLLHRFIRSSCRCPHGNLAISCWGQRP